MHGPNSVEQLDDAITLLEKGPLSSEEMERIKRIGDYIYKH
jgi:hypothetical protein